MYMKFKKVYRMIQQFGIEFSFKYYLFKLLKDDEKYIDLVSNYLKEFTKPLIDKYNNVRNTKNNIRDTDKIPVWVCWFQGKENMPEVCKLCYSQLEKMLPNNASLNLITFDNYQKYISFPKHIIDKVKNGKLSNTHLSDILRWALLEKYGGLWIDSTVFVSKKITDEFLDSTSFWSVKLKDVYDSNCIGQVISNCNWSSFILKDRESSLITKFMLEATIRYWEEHEVVIDYFMQNLLIKIAYENIGQIKKSIENIEINNPNIYDLHILMNEKFEEKKYDDINKNTTFFKLTWKKQYLKTTEDGCETFYRVLLI